MKKKIAYKAFIAVFSMVLAIGITYNMVYANTDISYNDNIEYVKELNIDVIEHNLQGNMFRDILTVFNLFADIPLDIWRTAAFTKYNNYLKVYEIYYNIDIQILMNDIQILCIKNHEYGHVLAFENKQYSENSDYTNRKDCNELFKTSNKKE